MVHTNVAWMRVASTAKALTAVSALMDIAVMENSATISTNVVSGLATGTRLAQTQTARTFVAVIPVSEAMDCHVMIMMSAKQLFTIVIRKPCVPILGARITVLVQKATKEMAESVKVSKVIQF